MKRLLLCGLVLMLMSAFLPRTTCSGYNVPTLEVKSVLPGELFVSNLFIIPQENFYNQTANAKITDNDQSGLANYYFYEQTASSLEANETRQSTNVLITGFT
jgi:hypothetical protein